MKNLISYLFFGFAAVFLAFALVVIATDLFEIHLPFGENTIDIQFHDTYFVVGYWNLVGGCIAFLFLTALLYYLIQRWREIYKSLVIVHFGLLLTSFIALLMMPYAKDTQTSLYETSDMKIAVIGVCFFLAQMTFLFNVILTLLLSPRKTLSK